MHFRCLLVLLIVVAGSILEPHNATLAQAPEEPAEPSIGDKHAWAQFGVGSWKRVRVYTESLDGNGKVKSVSITETKTTLEEVDEQGYALKVDVTVEVAGKRFMAEPNYVAYGYHGELQGQAITVKELEPGHASICSHKYETRTRQIVINGDKTQSVTTVQYSDTVAPYFLKRTTETIDNGTKEQNYQSVVEVIAVNMPEKVLTEVKSAAHVKTIETFGSETSQVTKVTLEVHCDSVPGGVVSHTSKQLDATNTTTQRSTLELIDYEAINKEAALKQPLPVRRRLLPRRRK